MLKEELAEHIKRSSYVTGEFILRSGKTTPFYFDKYRFESDPIILSALAEEMCKLLPASYDKIAGLELGGIPIATILSHITGKLALYIRKEAKTYGTKNLIEGGFDTGDVAVVIEDVITTAGQVRKSVEEMRSAGLVVNDVICAVNRQQGGEESLEKIGCKLSSVFTAQELDAVSVTSA